MTANTWPDPARPGVPVNPERDGWHWVRRVENNRPFPLEWTNDWTGSRDYCWAIMGSGEPEDVAKNICYLAPVLTPDEATALQKRCEEAERERDALRRDTSQQVTTDEMVRRLQHLGDWQAADRIEALQKRADRNAAGFARVDAEAERAKFLHKQEIAALKKRVAKLKRLVQCLIDEDPNDMAADGGVTVLDVWRKEARAALEGGKDE